VNWYEEVRVVENKEIDQYIEELEEQKDERDVAAIILGFAFIGVLGILVTVSICGGLG
jgi:hypothetical protein